ncbi:MAG TPA: hypothetical protein VJ044_13280, partial [Candidatus Hodarchaeales archaeon]|nr:hypothetical protein [Candidatus Hodarchaeales archaeon]
MPAPKNYFLSVFTILILTTPIFSLHAQNPELVLIKADDFNDGILDLQIWQFWYSNESTFLREANQRIEGFRNGTVGVYVEDASISTGVDSTKLAVVDVDIMWNIPQMGEIFLQGSLDNGTRSWILDVYDDGVGVTPGILIEFTNTTGATITGDYTGTDAIPSNGAGHLRASIDLENVSLHFDGPLEVNASYSGVQATQSVSLFYRT